MKCPYRDFKECIIEQCPSCNYEVIKEDDYEGFVPYGKTMEEAIELSYLYKVTKTTYKFTSCKLIDNCVQPVPSNKQVVNNMTKTNVSIRKSVF